MKLTRQQAEAFWNTCLFYKGYPTQAAAIADFIGVPTYKIGFGDQTEEIATFLRELADALETTDE